MKTQKVTSLIGGGLLLMSLSVTVIAQQVKIYEHAPSAEEMGQYLFGKQQGESVRPKTRGLVFALNDETPAPIEVDEPVNRNAIGFLIEFAFDSSDIQPASRPFLEEMGKMLTMQDFADKNIIIEGHADASGPENYNLNLSKRRADTIKKYLEQNFGISSSRLIALGQGETQPLPGKDPYDKLNRRVQFYNAN